MLGKGIAISVLGVLTLYAIAEILGGNASVLYIVMAVVGSIFFGLYGWATYRRFKES